MSPTGADPVPTGAAPAPTDTSAVRPVTSGRRAQLSFGHIVSGLVLVALGAVWLAAVVDLVDIRAALVIPGLLAVVGLALLVGSLRGSHPALLTVGVVLSVITLFSALYPAEALRGGVGQRTYAPQTSAQLESRYDLAIGNLTLDLSELDLDRQRRVNVSVGVGDLVVVVPPDLALSVEASVGAGEIVVFDERADGLSVERAVTAPGADDGPAHLRLDLDVGAGRIEVRR